MIHISMYDATSIQGEDGEVGDGWGRVVGWLSAAESDFADAQGRAAALWHVRFDDVALGEEDLEEQEVKAAFIAWELATRAPCPPPAGGVAPAFGLAGHDEPRVWLVEERDDDVSLPLLARALGVEAEALVALNAHRYKGLRNAGSCRLKALTVLAPPPPSRSLAQPSLTGGPQDHVSAGPPARPHARPQARQAGRFARASTKDTWSELVARGWSRQPSRKGHCHWTYVSPDGRRTFTSASAAHAYAQRARAAAGRTRLECRVHVRTRLECLESTASPRRGPCLRSQGRAAHSLRPRRSSWPWTIVAQ